MSKAKIPLRVAGVASVVAMTGVVQLLSKGIPNEPLSYWVGYWGALVIGGVIITLTAAWSLLALNRQWRKSRGRLIAWLVAGLFAYAGVFVLAAAKGSPTAVYVTMLPVLAWLAGVIYLAIYLGLAWLLRMIAKALRALLRTAEVI